MYTEKDRELDEDLTLRLAEWEVETTINNAIYHVKRIRGNGATVHALGSKAYFLNLQKYF